MPLPALRVLGALLGLALVVWQPPPPVYSVTVSPHHVAPGEALTIAWTAAADHPAADWVGLYKAGESDQSYLWWQYVTTHIKGAIVTLAPSTPGAYEARMFRDNGYTRLATGTFTVALQPPLPPPPATGKILISGCPFTLQGTPPDPSWKRARFRRGTTTFINIGAVDAIAPYEVTTTLPAGQYAFSIVWSTLDGKTVTVPLGTATVTIAAGTTTCTATALSAPPPPPPPPPLEPPVDPPPPTPVDCVVSAWSAWTPTTDWGPCQASQQTRPETRTRTIVAPPAHGGTACPVLTETRTVSQACAVGPPPPPDPPKPPVDPPPPDPPPTPSTSHPRLLMTVNGAKPTVADMKALLGTGGARHANFQQFVDVFCRPQAQGGIFDRYVVDNYDKPSGLTIYGFILATHGAPGINYSGCATPVQIDAVFLLLFDAVTAGAIDVPEAYGVIYAYDWGFARLNATRRQQAVTFLQKTHDEAFAINPQHHVRSRSRLLVHAQGLVYAGDGIADADATKRLALRTPYVTGPTGNRNASTWVAGTDGGVASGWSYAFSGSAQGHLYTDWQYHEMWRTAQGDATTWNAGVHTALEYFPQWTAYLLAPYRPVISGEPLYLVNKTQETATQYFGGATPSFYWTGDSMPFFMFHRKAYQTTNPNMAALSQWLLDELFGQTVPIGSGSATLRYAVMGNFIGYANVAGKSPSALNLPLSKCFQPYGYCSLRTGWGFTGADTHVTFHAPPYQFNNTTWSPTGIGSFTIERRGPLVIHPGSGAHNVYQEQGYGYNTIIFPNPSETAGVATSWWDRGAKRAAESIPTSSAPSSNFTVGSKWDLGGLKADSSRVDLFVPGGSHAYDYLYTDSTRAYNGPLVNDGLNTQKVENFERQLVVLRPTTPGTSPGFTVIYDRTRTTGTQFEPRWLLHPAGSISGAKTLTLSGHTSSAAGPIRGTSSAGKTTYTQPTLGAITVNAHGLSAKAFWTPLLPLARKVIEVGGPNSQGGFYQEDSHEYEDPYGVHCGPSKQCASSGVSYWPWEGQYRYELLAQTPARTQNFLNVIEDTEPGSSATSIELVQTATMEGVRIGTTRAAFFKNSPGIATTGSLVLSAVGTYDVLIADLPAGAALTFSKGANVATVTHIGSSDTDLTYTTTVPRTLWLRIVVTAAGSGAANTVSW